MTPACFDTEIQFDEWQRWAGVARVHPRQDGTEVPNFCQDCTPRYQAQMQAEGRCAYPGTKFTRVKEAQAGKAPVAHEIIGYEGVRPATADYVPPKKPAAARVSGQPASHSLPGAGGSPQPTPALAVPSVGPRLADALSRTPASAPPVAAPGTGSEPAQS
jgi:hypothetical protein